MPRRLARLLDQPLQVRYDDWGGLYLDSAADWYECGLELSAELRGRVLRCLREGPGEEGSPSFVRYQTAESVLLHYPCDEFLRPFRRLNEKWTGGWGFRAWFHAYPELAGTLRPFVVERAGRFNEAFVAIQAGLCWYRWFEGGEEALRAVANAIHRADRRCAALGPPWRDDRRHELREHGGTFEDEAREVDRHLAALGAAPLVDDVLRHFCYASNPQVGPWREPGRLLRRFVNAARVSFRFAGASWSDGDALTYARAWAALPIARAAEDAELASPPMDGILRAAARL